MEISNYTIEKCIIKILNSFDKIYHINTQLSNISGNYIYGHLKDFEKKKITKIGFIEEIKELLLRTNVKLGIIQVHENINWRFEKNTINALNKVMLFSGKYS